MVKNRTGSAGTDQILVPGFIQFKLVSEETTKRFQGTWRSEQKQVAGSTPAEEPGTTSTAEQRRRAQRGGASVRPVVGSRRFACCRCTVLVSGASSRRSSLTSSGESDPGHVASLAVPTCPELRIQARAPDARARRTRQTPFRNMRLLACHADFSRCSTREK